MTAPDSGSLGRKEQPASGENPFLPIDDPRLAFITNKWSRTVIQPILISLLMTALFSAILVLTEIFTSNGGWLPFAYFILFVTLEGSYTTLWLQHSERRLLNHTAYRAAELLLLFLLLRLFAWSVSGTWPQWAELPDLLRSPGLLLVDGTLIWTGILALAAWNWATRLSATFAELAIDQAEIFYYSKLPSQRSASDKPVRTNRGEIVLTYFRLWIIGALILSAVISMSNFDLINIERGNPFAITRLGLRPEMLMFLLIYFLAGLTLLSQARLAAMNARWLINGIQRGGQVERSWHRYTLWLLGSVALLAAFLPLGRTFAISNIIQSIIWAVSTAVAFILSLFSTLLGLFISLFTREGAEQAAEPLIQPTVTPLPTPTATPIPSALPPPIIDTGLLLSSMFWAVATVVTVMAISFFLRERGVRLETAVFRRGWHRLKAWLLIGWRGAGQQMRDWQVAVRSRLQTEEDENDARRPPWRFIRLGALSPREQIRYFYLSTLKRAANKGVSRQRDETPLEFAQDLKENWPEAEDDVDALTDAFLEARYGRTPIEKEDVTPVKKRWREVRNRLRRHQ